MIAYLNQKGIEAEQLDLNLEFYDQMLTEEFLDFCINKYSNDNACCEDQETYKMMMDFASYVSDNIEYMKGMFRSEKALDLLSYRESRNYLSIALSIINLAFQEEIIDFHFYQSKYNRDKFSDILLCAKHAYEGDESNMLNHLIHSNIDNIVGNSDVIGISLTGLDQVIPTFALAGVIRKQNPKIKIIIGGSVATRWFCQKNITSKIFDYVDYVILNEGEEPLFELIESLNSGQSIVDIPNIVYRDKNNKIIYSRKKKVVKLMAYPTPVFKLEDLNRYFSPVPTLPLLTSRGCYWGKCTFCDHSFIYDKSYRVSPLKNIISDIKSYIDKYNVKHINFHDEAMTPQRIKLISKAILNNNIDIRWSTDARFDDKLSLDLLELAYKAGLTALFFGLESISPRVIKMMKKGTDVDIIKRVLSDTTSSGILAHVFYMWISK